MLKKDLLMDVGGSFLLVVVHLMGLLRCLGYIN